jgi:hypothetical protein
VRFFSESSPQSQLKLGYVKAGAIGCGCAFSRNNEDFRNHRYIYIEGMDEPAFINLNGKNIELNPVSSSEYSGEEKIGQQSWETFTSGDLKTRLEKIVTKVCDPEDESCEVTYYKARMTLIRKNERLEVELVGSCGC